MSWGCLVVAALALALGGCGTKGAAGDDVGSDADADADVDADGDADADADADADGDADGDSDADGDADADADADADGDTDADGDADGDADAAEVVIGASSTDWGELDEGGELIVYEGHQGLSHFFAALKEHGLAIDPAIQAVYSFTPAEGGPSLVLPGAETIGLRGENFAPLDDTWMELTRGDTVVLDERFPEDLEGQTWVVHVEVTDAVGAVFEDERTVVIHAVPLN